MTVCFSALFPFSFQWKRSVSLAFPPRAVLLVTADSRSVVLGRMRAAGQFPSSFFSPDVEEFLRKCEMCTHVTHSSPYSTQPPPLLQPVGSANDPSLASQRTLQIVLVSVFTVTLGAVNTV